MINKCEKCKDIIETKGLCQICYIQDKYKGKNICYIRGTKRVAVWWEEGANGHEYFSDIHKLPVDEFCKLVRVERNNDTNIGK